MLTRIRNTLTAAWNRLLGRKPPPSDGGPTVTPTFGGRSR